MDNIAMLIGYTTMALGCIAGLLVIFTAFMSIIVKYTIGAKAFYNAYYRYLSDKRGQRVRGQ